MPLPESYQKVYSSADREKDWRVLHAQWHWEWFTPEEETEAYLEFLEWLSKGCMKLRVSDDLARNELPEQCHIDKFVADITEGYYQQFGRQMPSYGCYRLANYLMRSYLGSPNKKKTDKRQILSWRQVQQRQKKELRLSEETLDALYARKIHNVPKRKVTISYDDFD